MAVDVSTLELQTKTEFATRLRQAFTETTTDSLSILLMQYPRMQIDASMLIDDPYIYSFSSKMRMALMRSIEHIALILPRATNDFKIGALNMAFAGCNTKLAQLIVASGVSFPREDTQLLLGLLQQPEVFVGCTVRANFRRFPALRILARLAACYTSVTPDTLALVIQKGFDATKENSGLPTAWKMCLDEQERFKFHSRGPETLARVTEPKLAMLILAGGTTAHDLSLGYLNLALWEWKNCTPFKFRSTNEHLQAFIKAQAVKIVARFGTDVCIALQSLNLPALITCEILQAHCSRWPLIPFHNYWNLAVAVKHFQQPDHAKKRRRT